MPIVAPFTPGFNDFFAEYAAGTVPDADTGQIFNRLTHYNAKTLRFPLYWPEVEKNQGVFDWSFYYPLM